jgi:hypothetical protein
VIVRILAKIVALALLVIGLVVLGFGMIRYRLPYENGRYFDSQTQVVYHLEAGEVYLGAGALLAVRLKQCRKT